MPLSIATTFHAAFILLVVTAALSDYQRMKIPNWISLALCGLFAAFAFRLETWSSIGLHVVIGVAVFAVGILSYALGLFGGGDVKLLGAVALWAGPERIVEFLALTGLLGGALGLLIYAARNLSQWYPALVDRPSAVYNIMRWGRDGTCPYGIAIAVAALLSVPAMFVA